MAEKYSKNLEIEKIKPKIVKILKENGIKKAGIFGSYARAEHQQRWHSGYLGLCNSG